MKNYLPYSGAGVASATLAAVVGVSAVAALFSSGNHDKVAHLAVALLIFAALVVQPFCEVKRRHAREREDRRAAV